MKNNKEQNNSETKTDTVTEGIDVTEASDPAICSCTDESKDQSNEIVALNEKVKELEDKLLRQAADAENYRKRLVRDCDEKIKFANQSLLSGFLPILDNFDLALQHATPDSDVDSVIEGIKLTQKSLLDNLTKFGLTEIKTEIGDPFDPANHEAIMLCALADKPNNSITMIMQKGYKLTDRVVRPAKVQVNKC